MFKSWIFQNVSKFVFGDYKKTYFFYNSQTSERRTIGRFSKIIFLRTPRPLNVGV